MRVLLVNDLPAGSGGGVEVHLARLADGLRAAGDTVEVLAADPHPRLFDLWNPQARRVLRQTVASFRPDVVHFHNVLRELSVSVLGAVDVPAVLTAHDHRLLGAPDAVDASRAVATVTAACARAGRAIARRRVGTVIALADATASALRAAGFARVERIELFAPDPGPPRSEAGDHTDVVFAGRLAADKGAADLAAAFAQVAGNHPDARLVVAGTGPQAAELAAVADGLRGRIVLLGQVPSARVDELMTTARVVAVPSVQALRPETGPQTILEAALRARPVITCDGVPLAGLVTRSEGGAVVPPRSPKDLAAALDAALGDADWASAAGARARSFALEHHTPEAVIPRVRAVYEAARGAVAA